VEILFYIRSDGLYILVGDAHSIIINTNTAIIVSPIKIYCPFDLKLKRTPTVYQNVTQLNNKKKHSHDIVTK
jgi:hypothetical protein